MSNEHKERAAQINKGVCPFGHPRPQGTMVEQMADCPHIVTGTGYDPYICQCAWEFLNKSEGLEDVLMTVFKLGETIGKRIRNRADARTKTIEGLTLILTSDSCPEQYDVYDAARKQVGYLRLRWGCFYAACPDIMSAYVYRHQLSDGLQGEFRTHEERTKHLTAACKAINEAIKKQGKASA